MPNFFCLKNKKGFTIVELLVVIAIISIISVIFIPNYKKGAEQMALQRSANKLYQDFRQVQEMALSSRICAECADPTRPPIMGYGIMLAADDLPSHPYITTKKYIIYAHNDTENRYYYNPAEGDVIIKTIVLEKGVYVKSIRDTDPPASRVHLAVNFIPPEPTIGMECAVCGPVILRVAEITLALENNPAKTKTIRINAAGLIYEK